MLGGGGLLVRVPPPSAWRATHLSTFARRRRSGHLLGGGIDRLQLAVGRARADVGEHGGQQLVVVGQATVLALVGGHQAPVDAVLVHVVDAEHGRELGDHHHFGLRDAFGGGDAGLDGRLLEGVVLAVLTHEDALGARTEEVGDRADGLGFVGDHRHGLVDVLELVGRRRIEGDRDLAARIHVRCQRVRCGERAAGGQCEGDGQRDGLHLVHEVKLLIGLLWSTLSLRKMCPVASSRVDTFLIKIHTLLLALPFNFT